MSKARFFSVILTLAAAIGLYGFLATPPNNHPDISPRFDWPDQTANFFWIDRVGHGQELVVYEPLNRLAENQIHPRSFNVRPDGALVPGSFLGLLLLYGMIARLVGSLGVMYLTPLLAVGAAVGLYSIIKELFDQRTATVSALLLLLHPAWWYYASSPLLPNIPFIAGVVIGLALMLAAIKHRSWSLWLVAGIALGGALSIRPVEAGWVALTIAAVVVWRRRELSFWQFVVFIVAGAAMLVPTLYQQQLLYGSWRATGYDQLATTSGLSCSACQFFSSIIAPFGFHPYLTALNVWKYYISLAWWYNLLFIFGLAVIFAHPKKQTSRMIGYILFSLTIGAWLIVYYGSWQFSDQLTVSLNTIGISYVRYWLPLYILPLPIIAGGIVWLSDMFQHQLLARGLYIVVIITIVLLSGRLVLIQRPDSLLPVRSRVASYRDIAAQVDQKIEPNAVIITVRKDKVFFPERRVIHTFDPLAQNIDLVRIAGQLAPVAPIYYYALQPEKNLQLTPSLSLEPVETFQDEVLYRLNRQPAVQ